MASNSLTIDCDSSVTSGVLLATSSASSCLGGRNTRSQTTSSWSLNRRYTVWNPRLDIPTQ